MNDKADQTISESTVEPKIESITRLLVAIIQEQDERKAQKALKKFPYPVIRLSSSGVFLSRRNVTLLIGLSEDKEEPIMKAIENSCQERIEYISTPLESAPLPIPFSTPITMGGAKIFIMEIERYVEIR